MRKEPAPQRRVAALAVLLLAVRRREIQVARALALKVRLRVGGGVGFDRLGSLARAGLHVDHCHLQAREPQGWRSGWPYAGLGPECRGALVGNYPPSGWRF